MASLTEGSRDLNTPYEQTGIRCCAEGAAQRHGELLSDKPLIDCTSRISEISSTNMADSNIDGVLDITLHHANNIHNICIYAKQDVYAKFSITQAQDTVYSTQPVRGGGQNPVFNQSLQILISKLDAVLKCELWMMSCARNYLEDQLLGFVLVPLRELLSVGRTTRDYALSSTELFHTHAGTVCLSLRFYERGAEPILPVSMMDTSSTDVMAVDNGNQGMVKGHNNNVNHGLVEGVGNHNHDIAISPVDYANIEFPDLQVASENQHLVSMYLNLASDNMKMDDSLCSGGANVDMRKVQGDVHVRDLVLQPGPFPPVAEGDSDMMLDNTEQKHDDACNVNSAGAGTSNAGMPANVRLSRPTATMDISQTRVTAVTSIHGVSGLNSSRSSSLKKSVDTPIVGTTSPFACSSSSKHITLSPQSSSGGGVHSSSDDKTMSSSDGQEGTSSFANTPLVSISLDVGEPVVQERIVDMYMKSMQQFTESLANMKLPFDLDITQSANTEHKAESQSVAEKKGAPSDPLAKDGHRVFYGTRAFF